MHHSLARSASQESSAANPSNKVILGNRDFLTFKQFEVGHLFSFCKLYPTTFYRNMAYAWPVEPTMMDIVSLPT